MPKENEIAIYIGTFDAKKNKEVWKKDSVHKTLKEGYIVFKDLCKKTASYTYEEPMDVYGTPRLDVELMQGSILIKWFGIYEKPIEEPEEKEE
jgi:hypothetical protein